MLYYNTITKEYGLNYQTVKYRLGNCSTSPEFETLAEYARYTEVSKPEVSVTQYVVEVEPTFETEIIIAQDEEGNDKEVTLYKNGVQRFEVRDKEITSADIDTLKAAKKEEATSRRWEVETVGLMFPNGVLIKTAKEDQDRILSVIINAERDGITEINFKAPSGWVDISVYALKQIAKTLTRYVQHCFNIERYHHEQIDLLEEYQEIYNYDISTNWEFNIIIPGTTQLNTYDIDTTEIVTELYTNFIFPYMDQGLLYVTENAFAEVQNFIDRYYYGCPNLLPVQFYYVLAQLNIDDAINVLLPQLKEADPEKYALYTSYLNGARYYEFAKAYAMLQTILPSLLMVSNVIVTEFEEIKRIWRSASQL